MKYVYVVGSPNPHATTGGFYWCHDAQEALRGFTEDADPHGYLAVMPVAPDMTADEISDYLESRMRDMEGRANEDAEQLAEWLDAERGSR